MLFYASFDTGAQNADMNNVFTTWIALSTLAAFVCAIVPLLVRSVQGGKGKTDAEHQAAAPLCADKSQPPADCPVRWSFLPSTGILGASTPQAYKTENENAFLSVIALHRPTQDPAREKAGDYPYAPYFHGRKRLWEVRVTVKFKQLPGSGRLFIGLETRPPPVVKSKLSGGKTTKNLLLRAIQAAVGSDFYQSDGDDAATMEGEVEPPCFALPLWAADQIIVTEPGETPPDLTQDLSSMGLRRTQGLRKYKEAMSAIFADLSLDRTYTFSFWGVSQFLDVGGWEVRMPMGYRASIASMLDEGPLFVVFYELAEPPPGADPSDRRHLVSQKRYFFNIALWSNRSPPALDNLRGLLGSNVVDGAMCKADDGVAKESATRWAGMLSFCSKCLSSCAPSSRKA